MPVRKPGPPKPPAKAAATKKATPAKKAASAKPKEADGPGQDKLNQDDIEEEYGLSYALFKAFPELNDLLKKSIANNYTAQRFQVELRQTKWFQKHSDVWRENTALFYSDPATFGERLDTVTAKLGDLAASVGVTLGSAALSKMAKRALLTGMSDEELRNLLSQHVRPSADGGYTGDLASMEADLKQVAYANGVTLRDEQVQKWMQSIARGDASQDQFINNIRSMAAIAFPLYGDQVRGGMDLIDVATPYLQSMSEVLELAPGSVGLTDPTIRKALAGVRDANGKQAAMNTAEFEDLLRQDKRWGYTRQANETAQQFASGIAKMWGLQ